MQMKRFHSTLLAALLALTATPAVAEAPHVRVLSIGNSFSRDAFAYVPFLIEELAPGAQVDFGILYIGGCSLERHWRNVQSGEKAYEFDSYETANGAWQLEREVALSDGVKRKPWDIIILQQQSARSRYYDTYQPFLNDLLTYLKDTAPRATTAWLMTQAYGEGFERLEGMSSDEMWARINAASQRVVEETSIKMLIPAGTALQNARYTQLDRFGKFGHLVADGFHLHEGIAPLVEGLTVAHTLLRHYGVDVDVEASRLQITPQWREQRHTPQPNGQPEEATDEDYRLARRSARWAIEAPWQITAEER